ncbi:MAG TPA: hypothetical protein VFS52_17005 [Steroidobacteraceae bacterium]|nr:hypothetical protein [Steroidobacteraceae bacterium]
MTDKTLGFRSTGAAVVAALWGLTPFAAQAVEGPTEVLTVAAAPASGCGAAIAGVERGGKPFSIAVEPRTEPVKGAPFSGVGTSEIVTTLADGNRIVRTNTMKYYRDSRGRTRTEYSLAAIGPFTPDQAQSVVTITDPIEGKRYVLRSGSKHADILPLPEARMSKAAESGEAGSSTSSGITTRTAPSGNVMYMPKAATGSAERLAARVGPRVGPTPAGPPVLVMSQTIAALPPANAGFIMQYAAPPLAAGAEACKPNAKPLPAPTPIGERIMEGLKVTGTRMEFTIDAGAVGNELPIVVSSEQWFSPDLGVVVASTVRDPMMGDTTYKLEQISRAEPDASLFTIPPDYTTTDLTAAGGMFFESGMPAPDGGPGPVTRMGVRILAPGAAPSDTSAPAKPGDK